jgi:D-glycero-D-manno-heptose 1,7-bisphosphate phosphatase
MNRVVFLDRDGVINRKAPEGQYITTWESMEFLPGVGQAISALKAAGFQIIVISNQRCVAKGLISISELEALHQLMADALRRQGAALDAIYYCPHDYHTTCDCRKPKPGMLLQAAREHDIEMSSSWMIGDTDVDIQAGKTAGCYTIHVSEFLAQSHPPADLVAFSLLHASEQIIQSMRPSASQLS